MTVPVFVDGNSNITGAWRICTVMMAPVPPPTEKGYRCGKLPGKVRVPLVTDSAVGPGGPHRCQVAGGRRACAGGTRRQWHRAGVRRGWKRTGGRLRIVARAVRWVVLPFPLGVKYAGWLQRVTSRLRGREPARHPARLCTTDVSDQSSECRSG